MNEQFHNLIKKICKKNNIKYKLISNDWIIILEKNNIKKIISGYKFDLNTYSLAKIFDDKYATYELLKTYNIDVVEHNLLYSKENKNEYTKNYNTIEYIMKLYNKYNKKIVLKINNGSCGKEVYKIETMNELKEKYQKLDVQKSYSICPFYRIENEYRTIILNNKIKLMYKKELPVIYGDGKSTIKELLCKFNNQYFKNIDNNKILKANKKYVYNWKFNLEQGSKASFEIDEEDKKEILKIINKILDNFQIGFCSIDIIKTKNKFMVLEINSGVMMTNLMKENKDKEEIIYNIYEEAIKKMFEE